MSEFSIPATLEAREYLHDIMKDMTELFGISYREAVARINYEWRHLSFNEWPDLISHELPEHWAYRLYYGEVAYWDSSADRSKWVAREMPPRDSRYWTIRDNPEVTVQDPPPG